ncbi:hypothetical protein HMPREF0216_01070 [Clostridium celatum DSM 1785]|uniref:Uncharacterized protein n=1 Tax=Clostridium celatum DSM 1785 TaxID=545697 RepID=L1QIW5_9CLOT|nr:hypothetical protein HMPREF0216_01070 [Clostridium celatum DSM 1785]
MYSCFLELCEVDAGVFKEEVATKVEAINNNINENDKINGELEKKFLLLCSLVNMSNMYRRMSEKLIDEFFSEGEK